MAPIVKQLLRTEASRNAHQREFCAPRNPYQVSAKEDRRKIHKNDAIQVPCIRPPLPNFIIFKAMRHRTLAYIDGQAFFRAGFRAIGSINASSAKAGRVVPCDVLILRVNLVFVAQRRAIARLPGDAWLYRGDGPNQKNGVASRTISVIGDIGHGVHSLRSASTSATAA